MDRNQEIIARLKELNEKLAQLINTTKETYQILDEVIKKRKTIDKTEKSDTSSLANSANQWLN
ncbi:hypothetical protein BH23BAC1_BH23BAC1_08020 [soil metagenome]